MILIAALGFAAVGADTPRQQETTPVVNVLPASLSARVAAASFSAVLNPEISQTAVVEETVAAPVEQAAAPRVEPTTVTTTTAPPPTTTTTAAPATTTTASPPPTTTTTAPPPSTTTTAAPATTTTAAAVTTTTEPPVEGGSRDVAEWRPLAELYFPSELFDEALSVIRCESKGDPLAYNPRSGASGLFQFIPGTWSWASVNAGFSGASPFNPEANVGTAAWLVQTSLNQGNDAWSHWSCKP